MFLLVILFVIILFAALGSLFRSRRWMNYGYYRPYRRPFFFRRPYMRRDFYGGNFYGREHHHHRHHRHHHHHGGW